MHAHDDSGLRALLTRPRLYDAFQTLIGGDRWRRWYVAHLLRPHPGQSILDIGCGPGTMLRFLPAGVHYYGFDVNPRYIDYARRRFAGRGQFAAQRVEAVPVAAGGFDVVMANAILHHLDDAEAAHLIEVAWAQCKPGGFLLTYDNAWVSDQSPAARWLIGRDRGRYIRSPEAYLALARRKFDRIDTTVHHDGYWIPYTLFTMKAWRGGGSAA
ncbi:MAG: class I SAM-dependent methyltransferase [Deltaproteobacteria bacterium]|nr:class I SAM-dependent methyltransferase [Deltaproteobacteria bacterium]